MKVRNIAFSGFAAAILAAGAANAATVPQIASKQYVDDKVKADVQTLQTTVEDTYTKTADLPGVIEENIQTAMTATDGAIKTELDKKANAEDVTTALAGKADTSALAAKQDALNETQMGAVNSGITSAKVAEIGTNASAITSLQTGKEDASNKKPSITEENKASTTDFPTIGAVVTYTTAQIEKLSTDGVPVNPNNITDGSIPGAKLEDGTITNDKLSTELQSDIAGKADKITVTAEQVGNVATLDANGQYQVGDVKAADLATKANVTDAIATAVQDGGTVDTAVDNKINSELAAGGAINTALADKADADNVYSKTEADEKFDSKIPVPSDACQADSGRCVLSVATGSDGKTGLAWLDITAPLEGGTTPTPTPAE